MCEQGLPSVTCPGISATGIRFSNDFVDGQRPVCLRDFSTPQSASQTLNMLSSTERLSRPIRRLRAQKGDTASSHWTLSRRADDQNRCPGRCARQLVPLSASAGTSARHEGGCPLIHDVSFAALPADKAFDADWLLQDLDERGATAVIPPKSNRKGLRDDDTHMYKWRHLIENCFARIREFRGMATRYDKTIPATQPTGTSAQCSTLPGDCQQTLVACFLLAESLIENDLMFFKPLRDRVSCA